MDCKQKRMGIVGCFGQVENIKRQSLIINDSYTERENLSQLPYREKYSVKVQEYLYSVSSPHT